jgi:hypothetical protein
MKGKYAVLMPADSVEWRKRRALVTKMFVGMMPKFGNWSFEPNLIFSQSLTP